MKEKDKRRKFGVRKGEVIGENGGQRQRDWTRRVKEEGVQWSKKWQGTGEEVILSGRAMHNKTPKAFGTKTPSLEVASTTFVTVS